jgi:hypothetical protein
MMARPASRHRLSAKSSTSCNSGSTRCRQIRCWLLAMGEQLLGSRTKSWPPVHRHTEAQVNRVEPRPVSPFFAAPTAGTLRNRAATTAGSCLARPSATSPTGSTRRPANGPLRLCRVGGVLWEPSHPGRVKDADDRGPVMQAQFPAQRRRGLGTRRSPADAGHYRRRWRDNGQCWRPSPAVIYRAVAWPSSGLNVPRTTAAGALADPVGDTQATSPTIWGSRAALPSSRAPAVAATSFTSAANSPIQGGTS